ncbi:hypothetical protein K503DRAFT_49371 [Rhizopogon vinicolor AM-OR11-026]|uniref:Uncharacterized protein n=1 Tax=Rhizopogon vinicolor AM-OR11-026 TaxID=1314800 RepID=A0A1B7N4S7_9AGAM|nr:hypothetical protein K503DRAFT_49371 [Rhizopogon vinicolor AM-OR11-026]
MRPWPFFLRHANPPAHTSTSRRSKGILCGGGVSTKAASLTASLTSHHTSTVRDSTKPGEFAFKNGDVVDRGYKNWWRMNRNISRGLCSSSIEPITTTPIHSDSATASTSTSRQSLPSQHAPHTSPNSSQTNTRRNHTTEPLHHWPTTLFGSASFAVSDGNGNGNVSGRKYPRMAIRLHHISNRTLQLRMMELQDEGMCRTCTQAVRLQQLVIPQSSPPGSGYDRSPRG